jgi:DNA-binding winged helix-turn-helix (wHTH) protein
MRRKQSLVRTKLLKRLHDNRGADVLWIEASNGYGKSTFLQQQLLPTLSQACFLELSYRYRERSSFLGLVFEKLCPEYQAEGDLSFADINAVRGTIKIDTLIIDTAEVLSHTSIQALGWMVEQWVDVHFIISGRNLEQFKLLETVCDKVIKFNDADFAFDAEEINAYATMLEVEVNATEILQVSDGWCIVVDKLMRGAKAGFEPTDVMTNFIERFPSEFLDALTPLAYIEPWTSETPNILGVKLPNDYLEKLLDYGADIRQIQDGVYMPHRLLGQALAKRVTDTQVQNYRSRIATHYLQTGREVEAFEQYLSAGMREEAKSLFVTKIHRRAYRENDLSLLETTFSYFDDHELTLGMLGQRADNHGTFKRFTMLQKDIETLLTRATTDEPEISRTATTFAVVLMLKYGRAREALKLLDNYSYDPEDFGNEAMIVQHLAWFGYLEDAQNRLERLRIDCPDQSFDELEWYCLWAGDNLESIKHFIATQENKDANDRCLYGEALDNFAAMILGYQGEFEPAFARAHLAIRIATKAGGDALVDALCTEAEIHFIAGNLQLSKDAYLRADEAAKNRQIPKLYPKMRVIELRVIMQELTAQEALEQLALMDDTDTLESYHMALSRGTALLHNNQPIEAQSQFRYALHHWDAFYRLRALQGLEKTSKALGTENQHQTRLNKLLEQFAPSILQKPISQKDTALTIQITTLGQTKAYVGNEPLKLSPKNLITLVALEERKSHDVLLERLTKGGDTATNRDLLQKNISRLRTALADITEHLGLTPKMTVLKSGFSFELHQSIHLDIDHQRLQRVTPLEALEIYGGLFLDEHLEYDDFDWVEQNRKESFLEFEVAALAVIQQHPERTSEIYQRLHYFTDNDRLELGIHERGNKYLARAYKYQIERNHLVEAKQTLKLWERCFQKNPLKYEKPSDLEYQIFESKIQQSHQSRDAIGTIEEV